MQVDQVLTLETALTDGWERLQRISVKKMVDGSGFVFNVTTTHRDISVLLLPSAVVSLAPLVNHCQVSNIDQRVVCLVSETDPFRFEMVLANGFRIFSID